MKEIVSNPDNYATNREQAQEFAQLYGTALGDIEKAHRDEFIDSLVNEYGREIRDIYNKRVKEGPQQTVAHNGPRIVLPMGMSNLTALANDKQTGIYQTNPEIQSQIVAVEDQVNHKLAESTKKPYLIGADKGIIIARLPFMVTGKKEDVPNAYGSPDAYKGMSETLLELTKQLVTNIAYNF